MKKNLLIAILACVATISLAACCSTPSETPNAGNQSTSTVSDTNTNTSNNSETEKDVPTEYKSALKSAKTYSDMMHMSKQGIYDQLTSEYGDKFTAEAAQYAVDNLEADYNTNALKSAETYQETMNMSPAAIRDQLISEYGDKFTEEEADYAIANLK